MYPWLESSFDSLIARYKIAKLHHGLLFMGVADAGKSQLCHQIAKSLLCKTIAGTRKAAGETQSSELFEIENVALRQTDDILKDGKQ